MRPTPITIGTLTLATVAMLLMTGERWHARATHRPDILSEHGGAGVLVVYQGRDCPDARRAAERFLHLTGIRGIPLSAVAIPPGWGRVEDVILRRRLHRAILRSGLTATPAALLMDSRGTVRFAHPIRAGASEAELALAVEVFTGLLRLLRADEGGEEARNPLRGREG